MPPSRLKDSRAKGIETLEEYLRPSVLDLASVRRSLTEQANAVAILLTVSISALLYGWIEGKLWPHASGEFQLEIASHFTWYHVAFFSLFLVIGFSLSLNRVFQVGRRVWYLIVASAASMLWGFWLEDMSYFATTYPSELLQPGVWVEWGLGGFQVPLLRNYVPTMYVILSLIGFVAFSFAFWLARRDRIRAFAIAKCATLSFRPLNASLIRAFMVSLSVGVLIEALFLIAPALTSYAAVASETRIALLGLAALLPALVALALIDLSARRFLV